MMQLNVTTSIEDWHGQILHDTQKNDCVFFSNNISNAIWFATNYMQFLCRGGNVEVVPLYGRLVDDLVAFIYQANCSLPVGYKLKSDYDALYDLLLNFETEPLQRILFWNDADFLFKKNKHEFEQIFETMIVAAYCNRNAISTIKEDGSRYKVDQRNFFFFNEIRPDEIVYLLDKEYYIPSIDAPSGGSYSKIDFNIVELID